VHGNADLCGPLIPIIQLTDSATYTDSYGYTCADWAGYCSVAHSGYISACPTDPADPDCEVGGYLGVYGYYPAANMGEVRENCPDSCDNDPLEGTQLGNDCPIPLEDLPDYMTCVADPDTCTELCAAPLPPSLSPSLGRYCGCQSVRWGLC
jgi:hypothetical protein